MCRIVQLFLRMTAPVTSVDITDPALWGAALDPSLVVKSDLCHLHPEQHPKNKDIVSDIVCFIFKLCIRGKARPLFLYCVSQVEKAN